MDRRLESHLSICRFYGWTLDDVRALTVREHAAALKLMQKASK